MVQACRRQRARSSKHQHTSPSTTSGYSTSSGVQMLVQLRLVGRVRPRRLLLRLRLLRRWIFCSCSVLSDFSASDSKHRWEALGLRSPFMSTSPKALSLAERASNCELRWRWRGRNAVSDGLRADERCEELARLGHECRYYIGAEGKERSVVTAGDEIRQLES
jgi:hypothetical protein